MDRQKKRQQSEFSSPVREGQKARWHEGRKKERREKTMVVGEREKGRVLTVKKRGPAFHGGVSKA